MQHEQPCPKKRAPMRNQPTFPEVLLRGSLQKYPAALIYPLYDISNYLLINKKHHANTQD